MSVLLALPRLLVDALRQGFFGRWGPRLTLSLRGDAIEVGNTDQAGINRHPLDRVGPIEALPWGDVLVWINEKPVFLGGSRRSGDREAFLVALEARIPSPE